MTTEEFIAACNAIGIKSQNVASLVLGVSQGHISKIRRGERAVNGPLERLLHLLGRPDIGKAVLNELRRLAQATLINSLAPPMPIPDPPEYSALWTDGTPDFIVRAKARGIPFWYYDNWDDDALGNARTDDYDYEGTIEMLLTSEEIAARDARHV